jgi:origin recognition complex subunit 2
MPPSDDDDTDGVSSGSDLEAIVGTKGKGREIDDRRAIVESGFDAYFDLSASKAPTSSNIFSALIQPLSAEEYAESINYAAGSKHLQSSILLEPARSTLFSRFLCELNEGFNLICYGFGSKRSFLNEFASSKCSKAGHVVVVNGYHPELSVKDMLNSIENIPGIAALPLSSATPETHARRIYDFFSRPKQPHLYLVIHNIDYLLVRTPKARSCLSLLALHPHIHLISSVDHINAPLLWSTSEASARKDAGALAAGKAPPRGFAWLWHDLTTLAPYDAELAFADRTSVTGAHAMRRHRDAAAGVAAPAGTAMSETAAQHILASVTERARKLFVLMGARQLASLEAQDPAVGDLRQFAIPYDVLFPLARDNFIATNDTAMRSVLGEFRDHGLVVAAQGSSGGEVLWIPLRKERLSAVVKSLGVS